MSKSAGIGANKGYFGNMKKEFQGYDFEGQDFLNPELQTNIIQ